MLKSARISLAMLICTRKERRRMWLAQRWALCVACLYQDLLRALPVAHLLVTTQRHDWQFRTTHAVAARKAGQHKRGRARRGRLDRFAAQWRLARREQAVQIGRCFSQPASAIAFRVNSHHNVLHHGARIACGSPVIYFGTHTTHTCVTTSILSARPTPRLTRTFPLQN